MTALFPITAKAGSQGGQGGYNSKAKNDYKAWNVLLCVSSSMVYIQRNINGNDETRLNRLPGYTIALTAKIA